MKRTQDLHVARLLPLITPEALKAQLPMSEAANATVTDSREVIHNILAGDDPRMILVIGPCSIHDPQAALDYASRLMEARSRLPDSLYVVMRVYFEKPRTTIGWKGLINDPHLDGSCDVEKGLRLGRELLLKITEMGLPTGTEMLDPIVPQYLADLVCWAAIGARTTESQTHREMASGLSMPVGFKNSTQGNLQIAVDAMGAARHAHRFLGMDQRGQISVVQTTGNEDCHLILRGGGGRSNFDPQSVAEASALLGKAGLNPCVMVDCSHANSGKRHERQEVAFHAIIEQRLAGNRNLMGLMVESHLQEGNQKLGSDPGALKYGVSITDACVGWVTTQQLLDYAAHTLG